MKVSMYDALVWVCKLKRRNLLKFEYKDLPLELKNISCFHRARKEEFIIRFEKNHRSITWRISDKIISDKIKCKDEDKENLQV